MVEMATRTMASQSIFRGLEGGKRAFKSAAGTLTYQFFRSADIERMFTRPQEQ